MLKVILENELDRLKVVSESIEASTLRGDLLWQNRVNDGEHAIHARRTRGRTRQIAERQIHCAENPELSVTRRLECLIELANGSLARVDA